MTVDGRIGVIGLGVMGRNLALNMAEKGFSVAAYDPWEEAREKFAVGLSPGEAERIIVAETPGDLVAALAAPRTILIMVKAGEPVDGVIESLLPHLEKGSTLIDGGNSHYLDTIRREAALQAAGCHFIGLGISGGAEGARHGPSLMAGGAQAAYDQARPVLETIAARFGGTPCCARVGGDGAGHFVKMIHNGIEYGVMQLIAEAFVLLRDAGGLTHGEMAETFRRWNDTELSSYLVEITAGILGKKDDFSPAPLVEMILDKAGQKGTGRWSSEAALELGIPVPTITEAVFARALAALKEERVAAGKVVAGPSPRPAIGSRDAFVENVRQALLGATIVTYAQGLAVIEAASEARNWSIDLADVAAIWRAGCVIRARLLDEVMRAFQGAGKPRNLICAPAFAALLTSAQGSWRQAVCVAIESGIPVPGLSSALAYFDGYRSPRLWANMIQAQRDYFGAHTYERTDRKGSFHTEW
jgi:6-phosphogluconate dehydrogenase